MRRKWKVAAIGICAAMLVGACSAEPEKEETVSQEQTEEKKETPEEAAENAKSAKLDMISPSAYNNIEGLDLEPGTYFSVIGKGESEEYWQQIKAGAAAAVADLNKALGYEGSDKIKLVYSGPSTSDDVDEQVNILDEEMDRNPSALGIAVIDSQSCEVQFDLATQNGIPIVTFDSASNYQNIMAHVATDHKKAASEAADHMAELLGEEGQILMFSHDSKSTTSKERIDSFVEEIQSQYPNMSVTETYYMDNLDEWKEVIARERLGISETEGEEAEAEENTEAADALAKTISEITDEEVYDYILEKNPDIKGIYATNGQAVMNMVNLCERAGREDLVIIGYDADADEIQAVEDGKVAGLIVQNPYGMGYATVVAEARSVLEIGNEAEVDTGYVWVTGDNIGDKEIQYKLYTAD